MQPVTDYDAFFAGAKQAMSESDVLTKKVSELRASKSKLEASLGSEKNSMNESISGTVSKRRRDIEKTYNTEIDKCNDALRKANYKREKARNQGVKDRIAEETADLRNEVRSNEKQAVINLKNAGAPLYCNSGLFYSLYYPKSLSDILILLLAFAVFFFAVPYGLYYFFFHDTGTIVLVVIYIADVFAFGGLYTLIGRATVYRHNDVLLAVKNLKNRIKEDKKKIKEITESIQNDKDDLKYNLAQYDDEIAHIKHQHADVTMKKKEALDTFENVTKNIITEEIANNYRPRIEELGAALSDVSAQLKETETARNQKAIEISNNYECYLGREFMKPDKIDALQRILSHGTAGNISEAIEEYKRRTDI